MSATAPGVIVCDLNLPDMSGLDLCRYIKDDDFLKRITVILVSNRSGLQYRLQGFLAGAQRFLCRPYDIGEITDCVEFYAGNVKHSTFSISLADEVVPDSQEGYTEASLV